jgi:hypothetical protein
MTWTEVSVVGIASQKREQGCFASAVAGWLRQRHPMQTLKNVAADLRCSYKSAENLLNGHLSAAHTARLLAAYGPRIFIEASLAAAGTSLDAYIEHEAQLAADEQRRWGAEATRYMELGRRLGTGVPGGGDGLRPHP